MEQPRPAAVTQPPSEASIAEERVVTGNTPQTKPENRAFYPALDGLRAIAFLMVFFQHYRQQPWGWTGVDVFFVLSGFLITGILWDSRDDAHRVRNFYVRRTLRIFPLYYAVMLVILLGQPVFHWAWDWKWLVWPAYLGNYARFVAPSAFDSPLQRLADFQVHGMLGQHHVLLYLGHFWSLCVEEQFYLIWPWFVFFIRSRRALLWICGSSVVVCLVLRCLGTAFLPQWMLDSEVLYRATPFRLDALLFGGLLALWLRGPGKDALLRAARYVAPVMLALLLAWAAFSPYGKIWHHSAQYVYPAWKFTWGLTAMDLITGVVILLAIQPGTLLYRGLKWQALRWMGRITYGAYVLHDIPHVLYGYLAARMYPSHSSRLSIVLALVGTLVLAQLSFWLIETPFLNLKEKWTVRGARS